MRYFEDITYQIDKERGLCIEEGNTGGSEFDLFRIHDKPVYEYVGRVRKFSFIKRIKIQID